MARRTGKTREQMLKAPIGAFFIWCNHHTDYPKYLAEAIGRKDLNIVAPSWLDHGWQGRTLTGIVVDHASDLNSAARDNLDLALLRVQPPDSNGNGNA